MSVNFSSGIMWRIIGNIHSRDFDMADKKQAVIVSNSDIHDIFKRRRFVQSRFQNRFIVTSRFN